MKVKRGFTLIELLVVISIIALLMAILMPALARVREQARTTVCKTQLKQFGTAWNMYSQSNKDMNLCYQDWTKWATGDFWFYQLGYYMGDQASASGAADTKNGVMEILRCPSTKAWKSQYGTNPPLYGGAKMCWQWDQTTAAEPPEGSYAINAWMQQRTDGMATDKRFYKRYSQAKPEVPLICDGAWVDAWPDFGGSEISQIENQLIDLQGAGYPGTYRMPGEKSSARILLDRHNMAINIVFADTHVDLVKLEELWNLPWHRGFEKTPKLDLPKK